MTWQAMTLLLAPTCRKNSKGIRRVQSLRRSSRQRKKRKGRGMLHPPQRRPRRASTKKIRRSQNGANPVAAAAVAAAPLTATPAVKVTVTGCPHQPSRLTTCQYFLQIKVMVP